MKEAIFESAGHMIVKDVPMPQIQADDDAIIRVVRTCVCGSDLWDYRGIDSDDPAYKGTGNSGHEGIGVVEKVGSAITSVKPGDFVIMPFTHGDGQCASCEAGYDGSCSAHPDNFSGSYQAEYVRFQHAQWALVKVPGKPSDYSEGMLKSLLALSDVMATGYHAARLAEVSKGDTVAVIGDGAVGLSGVIAAKLRGAKRIILMSRHEDRQKLGIRFGATDIVAERGDEGVKKVLDLTNGGVDAALECVGTEQAMDEAVGMVRGGGRVGRVGLPHGKAPDAGKLFFKNVLTVAGPASVTTYDKSVLLKAVLDGRINPGLVFTQTFDLDHIDDAYQAMAQRKAIKSYITVSD